ncbi:sugar nucleotide-binding protein [Streptomyces sp. NPDC003691]
MAHGVTSGEQQPLGLTRLARTLVLAFVITSAGAGLVPISWARHLLTAPGMGTTELGVIMGVSTLGPVHLAMAAANHGIRLVHLSSDAVFSGTRIHYDETALPDPLTPCGAAKSAAETGVLAVHPKAAVTRTSLIIGHGRSAHERLVHRLATGTSDGVLFTDDIRCPVHVTDLAAALLELADGDRTGIHHLAGPDAVSRHGLGNLIARRDGFEPTRLPTGRRADSAFPSGLNVRLDSRATQQHLPDNTS